MPSSRKRNSQFFEDEEEEEEEEQKDVKPSTNTQQLISSQVFTLSQPVPEATRAHRQHFDNLSDSARNKALSDLARYCLFKGLTGEPIDKTKCTTELGEIKGFQTAAFEEANQLLEDTFGFTLRRLPKWMQNLKKLPAKFTNRFYLLNTLQDDGQGRHSQALHCVHDTSAVEKGFLMMVLAFWYCRGQIKADGSRWLLDSELYTLLHKLDFNLPEYPTYERSKKRRVSQSQRGTGNLALTPDADALLQKFVQQDYLWQRKATELDWPQEVDEKANCYSLGPRGAMEISRKQIVYFCAEVLGQEPDPTMLAELKDDDEEAVEPVTQQTQDGAE